MSTKHPVIAVTGSSGAGTSTVMKSFAHIFRREGIKAQVIEGDSFHRYNRVEMRARVKAADAGEGPQISHFGPESNLLADLATAFETYGTTGTCTFTGDAAKRQVVVLSVAKPAPKVASSAAFAERRIAPKARRSRARAKPRS